MTKWVPPECPELSCANDRRKAIRFARFAIEGLLVFGARTWIGHSGGSPGIKAVVAFSPGDQAFVAVALTGDGSAEACANLLLTRLTSGKQPDHPQSGNPSPTP